MWYKDKRQYLYEALSLSVTRSGDKTTISLFSLNFVPHMMVNSVFTPFKLKWRGKSFTGAMNESAVLFYIGPFSSLNDYYVCEIWMLPQHYIFYFLCLFCVPWPCYYTNRRYLYSITVESFTKYYTKTGIFYDSFNITCNTIPITPVSQTCKPIK